MSHHPVPWLVRSVRCHGATGVVLWGCHSNLSEEKMEGADVALGHPRPSCSLSVALWQVSSYGGPAGQIDNSMRRPAPAFYKHHFTASVFVWQTPYNTQYALCHHPPNSVPPPLSLFFLSTTPPCVNTVLRLWHWFLMGCSCSHYKRSSHQEEQNNLPIEKREDWDVLKFYIYKRELSSVVQCFT